MTVKVRDQYQPLARLSNPKNFGMKSTFLTGYAVRSSIRRHCACTIFSHENYTKHGDCWQPKIAFALKGYGNQCLVSSVCVSTESNLRQRDIDKAWSHGWSNLWQTRNFLTWCVTKYQDDAQKCWGVCAKQQEQTIWHTFRRKSLLYSRFFGYVWSNPCGKFQLVGCVLKKFKKLRAGFKAK